MADAHGLRPLFERVVNDPGRAAGRPTDPAWGDLLGRVRGIVRGQMLACVRDPNDASDLAQEVQGRVVEKFDQFRGDTLPAFLAWVGQIARHKLADYRRRTPRPADRLSDHDPPAPTADAAPDPDLTDQVMRAVEELPEPSRGIVRAFYLGRRSCQDIGREIGRPEGWVRLTKFHAVQELRQRLREPS